MGRDTSISRSKVPPANFDMKTADFPYVQDDWLGSSGIENVMNVSLLLSSCRSLSISYLFEYFPQDNKALYAGTHPDESVFRL